LLTNEALIPQSARLRTKSQLHGTTNKAGKLWLNKNGFSLFFGKFVEMVLK